MWLLLRLCIFAGPNIIVGLNYTYPQICPPTLACQQQRYGLRSNRLLRAHAFRCNILLLYCPTVTASSNAGLAASFAPRKEHLNPSYAPQVSPSVGSGHYWHVMSQYRALPYSS